MLDQRSIFDGTAARALRDTGRNRAVSKKDRRRLLELARHEAARAACRRAHRTATADDARAGFDRLEISWGDLGNAAGSIFANQDDWIPLNQFVKSRATKRRCGMLRVWRYVGTPVSEAV